jgi:hypothetical protein
VLSCVVSAWLSFSEMALAVGSAERSAARQLAEQGVRAYEAADYQTALDRLERAHQTLPTPVLALWSARALEKVGRWVEASERYLQATRIPLDPEGDAAVQEKARQDAAIARESLVGRIPTLVVEVEGAAADLEVTVGGRKIGPALVGADMPTDPGPVQVTARAGGETVEQVVELAERERKVARLVFSGSPGDGLSRQSEPAPPAQDETSAGWQRPVAWAGIGLGAVGVGLGIGFGLDAISKRDASETNCNDDNQCGPTGTELRNAGLTSATISTTAFAVGAALAVGGVVLWITAPKKEAAAMSFEAAPSLAGAMLRFRGQF